MSEIVLSEGFMVPLAEPVKDYEEYSEWLYENSPLRLNYEGTLIYSGNQSDPYGMFFMDAEYSTDEFFAEIDKLGLDYLPSEVRRYICIWYNGVDSNMDMLTLKEFMNDD